VVKRALPTGVLAVLLTLSSLGGNPDSKEMVVERKFSNSLKIYSPYHVQAQLYCLGLGEMGFNNTDTLYRIMVFKRSCYECD